MFIDPAITGIFLHVTKENIIWQICEIVLFHCFIKDNVIRITLRFIMDYNALKQIILRIWILFVIYEYLISYVLNNYREVETLFKNKKQ